MPGKPGPAPRAAHSRSGSVGVRVDEPAVGRHHVQPGHALAGPPARPPVPALPALQQVAAEADRGAVPGRERPSPPGQERRELEATRHRPAAPRPPRSPGSVGDVAQPGKVDQQSVVAQAPRRPRVPAGAHADRPAALGRQPDALDHVVIVRREQDCRRKPVRAARVEDAADPGLLVAGLAAAAAGGRPARHPTTAAPPSTGISRRSRAMVLLFLYWFGWSCYSPWRFIGRPRAFRAKKPTA